MSRWTEKFESHGVHQTLAKARELLDVEVDEADGAHEQERRRLIKVVDTIKEVVSNLDPEVLPEDQLESLNNHLMHANFLNQLQAYSSDHDVGHLKTANEHVSARLTAVHVLAAISLKCPKPDVATALEASYDNFCKVIASRKAELEEEFREFRGLLERVTSQSAALSADLDGLKERVSGSLNEWSGQFTDAQSKRAAEFSNSQIERNKEFEESMRVARGRSETQIKEITEEHEGRLEEKHAEFTGEVQRRLSDARDKHADILEIHGLVGEDGVAGGYQKGAVDERNSAILWRRISVGFLLVTAGWILLNYFLGFETTVSGSVNWSEVIKAASLTLVLLAGSGYASRQSKIHRDAEQHMHWFALEVKAIDPFLSSLPAEQRNELKTQLTQNLFGQNRTSSGEPHDGVDPAAFKTIVDAVARIVKEAKV